MSPAEIEAYLRRHIPLSGEMQIRVVEVSERVVVEAPLEPNVNHRSTAFGGSVAALAILAGWTLVHFRLRSEGFTTHTVIQRSQVRYDAPIVGPFQAVAEPIDAEAWSRLTRALRRRGKGRVGVAARIETGGRLVGRFQGAYVALERTDT